MSSLRKRILAADLRKSLIVLFIIAACFSVLAAIVSSAVFSDQILTIEQSMNDGAGRQWLMAEYGFGDFVPLHIGQSEQVIIAVLLVAAAIIAALIYINIILWIYKAAAKAGMPVALWIFLALGGHIFALALFIIVRSMTRKKCPSCSSFVKKYDKYCTGCGHSFVKQCSGCGQFSDEGSHYCSNCGSELE